MNGCLPSLGPLPWRNAACPVSLHQIWIHIWPLHPAREVPPLNPLIVNGRCTQQFWKSRPSKILELMSQGTHITHYYAMTLIIMQWHSFFQSVTCSLARIYHNSTSARVFFSAYYIRSPYNMTTDHLAMSTMSQ